MVHTKVGRRIVGNRKAGFTLTLVAYCGQVRKARHLERVQRVEGFVKKLD
jgi:hypothetical protein